MNSKKWNIHTFDKTSAKEIARRTGLPTPIARLLVQRGFCSPEEIDNYLNPKLADLSDPFQLPAMEPAVSRIWKAVDAGGPIVVFGDYDVDGVTSTALLTRLLIALGAKVFSFIPDRMDEGYGLSPDAVERCIEMHHPAVIISVDCGTNSVESVAYAQQLGIDVIVTDHHEPEGEVAPAFALINPKLGDRPELEILSGVGVAFKLAHALLKTGREQNKSTALNVDLRDLLDLVALGTVADIVPLQNENRILVRHGLARIDVTDHVGLQALKEVAGVRGEVDTYHLGYQLGPRINAAGRIGQPMQALQLLLTEDQSEARRIAKLLDDTNAERRRIEREMADEAFAEIDEYFDPGKNFGLVVSKEGWHPGVVGIVASRVARHYNRPAIVLGIDEDGSARGSGRSIPEYNLLEGLQACEQHLEKYGGHTVAAGLTVKAGALEAFKSGFNEAAAEVLRGADLSSVQNIDAVVDAEEIEWDFMEQLKRLRPFGQNNPEPVWALRNVQVSGSPRVVGQNHLKLSVAACGKTFGAIAFNCSLEDVPPGKIDVAFILKENEWNGNVSLQLQVQDMRMAEPA